MSKKDISIQKIHNFLIIALAFFIPLPSKATNLITIALLGTLIYLIFKQKTQFKKQTFKILLLASPFIFGVLGLIHTQNFQAGTFLLEKQLSILIFPLLIIGTSSTYIRVDKIYYYFSLGAVVAFLACLTSSIFKNLPGGFSLVNYTSHELANNIGLHANYLSIFLVQSFFFFLKELYKHLNLWNILLLFIITLGIALLSSRIAIISWIIWGGISLFVLGFRYNKKNLSFSFLFVAIFSVSFMIIKINVLQDKFKELINYNNEYTLDKTWGGSSVRLLKWDCSKEIIMNHFLWGVGSGDAQDELQNCYIKKNYTPLIFWPDKKFNAHNEFLQIWIYSGIFGLLFLLWAIGFLGIVTIKMRQYEFGTFLFLFTMLSLVESTLEVNKGIIYFSFFASIIAQGIQNKKLVKG